MTASDTPARPLARRIFASILGLIGLVLIVGGAMLIGAGGSPYYLLAGLATAASGTFVWRGNRNGARVYAAPSCHHVPEVVGGVREAECAALLRDFFGARR